MIKHARPSYLPSTQYPWIRFLTDSPCRGFNTNEQGDTSLNDEMWNIGKEGAVKVGFSFQKRNKKTKNAQNKIKYINRKGRNCTNKIFVWASLWSQLWKFPPPPFHPFAIMKKLFLVYEIRPNILVTHSLIRSGEALCKTALDLTPFWVNASIFHSIETLICLLS